MVSAFELTNQHKIKVVIKLNRIAFVHYMSD